MKRIVYLSGPITGGSYASSVMWRDYVTKLLAPNIRAVSPMRGKSFLRGQTKISGEYPESPLCTAAAMTARDRFDVKDSDVMLVNLIGSGSISIGTMIELGWADAFRVPIVLAISPSDPCYNHPLVKEICAFKTENLREAVDIVNDLIGEF